MKSEIGRYSATRAKYELRNEHRRQEGSLRRAALNVNVNYPQLDCVVSRETSVESEFGEDVESSCHVNQVVEVFLKFFLLDAQELRQAIQK